MNGNLRPGKLRVLTPPSSKKRLSSFSYCAEVMLSRPVVESKTAPVAFTYAL